MSDRLYNLYKSSAVAEMGDRLATIMTIMGRKLGGCASFSERVRDMLSPVRLWYVVCNVHAPYSGGSNFRQYFYGIRYLCHPLTSTENFTEIVPRGTPPPGELNTRGVAKYSDFGPIDGYAYISETVQDSR